MREEKEKKTLKQKLIVCPTKMKETLQIQQQMYKQHRIKMDHKICIVPKKTKAGNSVTSKGKQNVSVYLCAHFCKDLHLFFRQHKHHKTE